MGHYFLESSALVKRYKQETGTAFIDRLFAEETHELFYLNLAVIEIRKVFYRLWKYPQGGEKEVQITDEAFMALEKAFANDLRRMRRIAFTEDMIDQSIKILEQVWVRSVFDLAHLSAYLVAQEA